MPYKDKKRRNEYHRKRARKTRSTFFAGKCCAFCGSTHKLELHHIDKSKKESHHIWSWSPEHREAELAKCIVLCQNCHRELHAEERRRKPVHGSASAYRRGCRCKLCRKNHSIRMKDYQRRIKIRDKTGVLPEPAYAQHLAPTAAD